MPKNQGMCHYCGEENSTTLDHVVPKKFLRMLDEKLELHRYVPPPPKNTVPCCQACNQAKAAYRSKCECDLCITAWAYYRPRIKAMRPNLRIKRWAYEIRKETDVRQDADRNREVQASA